MSKAASVSESTLPLPPAERPRGRPVLRVHDGAEFDLKERTVIGSGPEADLRLDDPYVSAKHAEIRDDGWVLTLTDLQSTNGTWIGGRRVDTCALIPGLVICVGQHRLEVRDAALAGPLPPAYPQRCRDAAVPREGGMIGSAPALRALQATLRKVAPMTRPVLLRGETGTGKELAARYVHDCSPRHEQPFVAVNCAAIVGDLAESTLFGHLRGAFTGAHRDHGGEFVHAHGGTLFLDEIAELPLTVQAKLLRVLDTGEVHPLGAASTTHVDVRLVCATHRDLESMIASGSLREDLYHRISVLSVDLPPLRERPDDIPALLLHFAHEAGAEVGRPVVFSSRALAAARNHHWSGNIRALRNAVMAAAALCEGTIEPDDLLRPTRRRAFGNPQPLRVTPGHWSTMSRDLLLQAVEQYGSIRRAAIALGIPRSTLQSWLRR